MFGSKFPWFLGENCQFFIKKSEESWSHFVAGFSFGTVFLIFLGSTNMSRTNVTSFWPTTFSIVLLWLQLDTICCDHSHWNGAMFLIVRAMNLSLKCYTIRLEIFKCFKMLGNCYFYENLNQNDNCHVLVIQRLTHSSSHKVAFVTRVEWWDDYKHNCMKRM